MTEHKLMTKTDLGAVSTGVNISIKKFTYFSRGNEKAAPNCSGAIETVQVNTEKREKL